MIDYRGLFAEGIDESRLDNFKSLLGTHGATFKRTGKNNERLDGHIIVDMNKAHELMEKLENDDYVLNVKPIIDYDSLKQRVIGD
ncbi:MAG: hypothetical protein V1818_03135 [Candidatus Aenigmatarchaeota archaeon]